MSSSATVGMAGVWQGEGWDATRVRSPRRMKWPRRILVAGIAATAVIVVLSSVFGTKSLIVHPSDPCTERPPLVHSQGVILQPVAMRAYNKAQRLAHGHISVVQSYRS